MRNLVLVGLLAVCGAGVVQAQEADEAACVEDEVETITRGAYTITIKCKGGVPEKDITLDEDGTLRVEISATADEGKTVSLKVTVKGNGSSSSSSSASSGTAKVSLTAKG